MALHWQGGAVDMTTSEAGAAISEPPVSKRPLIYLLVVLGFQLIAFCWQQFRWFDVAAPKGYPAIVVQLLTLIVLLPILALVLYRLICRDRLPFTRWTSLALAAVIGLPLGWFAIELFQAIRQSLIVATIEAKNGSVSFDASSDNLPAYEWLKSAFGISFVDDVRFVWMREPNPEGLRGLRYFPRIKDVSLRQCELTDDDLAYLASLHNLRELSLESNAITGKGLIHLKNLKRLEFLSLAENPLDENELQHITGFTKLGRLYLNSTPITDRALDHVIGFERMRFLNLSNTKVGDGGLEKISSLKNLGILVLENTQVSDQGLQHVAGLTHLETILLKQTHITDLGLPQLAGLTELREISLSGPQITDAGMAHLESLTRLQRVDLMGTNVTDAAKENLRKKAPSAHFPNG
jgi:hypothetical protein